MLSMTVQRQVPEEEEVSQSFPLKVQRQTPEEEEVAKSFPLKVQRQVPEEEEVAQSFPLKVQRQVPEKEEIAQSFPLGLLTAEVAQYYSAGEGVTAAGGNTAPNGELAPFAKIPNLGTGLATHLSLAISPAASPPLLSRQVTETVPSETINPVPPAREPPAHPPAGNISQIAEQVSQIIYRRLEIERERRGLSR
jgi:hypothetical protein